MVPNRWIGLCFWVDAEEGDVMRLEIPYLRSGVLEPVKPL